MSLRRMPGSAFFERPKREGHGFQEVLEGDPGREGVL
jgi:hypothetical protein